MSVHRYLVTMTNGVFGSGEYAETVTTDGPDPFAAAEEAILRWRKRDRSDADQTHTWQADRVNIVVRRLR